MSAKLDEPWLTVQQAVDLFVAMGCEPQEFPGESVKPFVPWTVYYLYSPENDSFVSLVGYDMDDQIAPSTIENWERALGILIPKPNNKH